MHEADSGRHPLKAGDTILIPPGEKHVTRNTGTEPLVLLCFFPVADITRRTQEPRTPTS
ncbi:MAG: cupin domain-containing protein [Burkholderiales bacterium]|nr:cupin domain-containing protein [Burkholderiales bacterium]